MSQKIFQCGRLLVASCFVMLYVCVRHYSEFLQSECHCQHQIDLLTSTNVSLADILYNESALFYFMEVGLV